MTTLQIDRIRQLADIIQAQPPDPADTLVQVITDELRRQAEEPHGTQYVSAGLSDAVMLDGTFDLRQLAQAILKSGVLTL